MFDGAKVMAADVKSIDPKSQEPVPAGVYNAVLSDANCDYEFNNPGTEGLVLTYRIEGGDYDGRELLDFIITKTAKKELKFNYGRIKARLMALGVAAADIASFQFPKNGRGFGDFKNLIEERPITIQVEIQEGDDGKKRSKPVAVVPRGAAPYPHWPNPQAA